MYEHRIIISGFGGQGVLLLGKLLACAGMEEGRNVTWLPSYGPEMRGGTANCHVILSDDIIGAPIVSEATCVMAMNLPSLHRFEPTLLPGGLLLINRSMVPEVAHRTDIESRCLPANELAGQQGSLKVANVVMLGAYLARSQAVRPETITSVIRELLGNEKKHLLDINLRALDAGMRFAA